MGFLKKLMGKVASGIGSFVSDVGSVLNVKAIENFGNKIQSFGNKLAGKVAQTEAYVTTEPSGSTASKRPRGATVHQTSQLSIMLADFSRDIEQSADEIQDEIEGVVRSFFDGLNQMTDENHIGIPRQMIRKEQQDALKSMKGFLKSYVAKRVSLDDSECRKILEMDSGSCKERAMQDFTEKVLRKGKKALCRQVQDTVGELFDSFSDAFDDMMDDQSIQLENARAALDSLQDDTPSRERTQAQASSVLSGVCLVDHLLAEVNSIL